MSDDIPNSELFCSKCGHKGLKRKKVAGEVHLVCGSCSLAHVDTASMREILKRKRF